MSSSRLARRLALAAFVVVAGTSLGLPAIAADDAVTVTFQQGNPWAQEVGNVTAIHSSHDYTVSIAADKTFQINLVTRDPNLFFTVKAQGSRHELVDTMKTGATTWSIKNAAPTTYTIHVYVQPEAMSRDEVAEYALQIGQYGQADLQTATTAVTFQPNVPWAQVVGKLDSAATAHDYTVDIAAGTTLQVNLIARTPGLHFKVTDQAGGKELVDSAASGSQTWSVPATTATTYRIQVYVDAAAVPPGKDVGYALQIGHYASSGSQPATPGSAAAAPAAAATAQ